MKREEKWKGGRREKMKGWRKKKKRRDRRIACVGNRSVGIIGMVIQQQ